MDTKDLKAIAKQLKHPEGEHGTAIAHMMHETNIGMTRHAIALLELDSADQILEIGHGNANHVKEILVDQPKRKYTGLEISSLMHREGMVNNDVFLKSKQADFKMYDGEKTPFAKETFDKIFTVNTIYFLKEPLVMLTEFMRILKPNGKLNITFAHEDFMKILPFTQFEFNLYSVEKMKDLIESSAFKIFKISTSVEDVKNKNGEVAQRNFSTFTLVK